jgi:translation elongation factor EF-1alpha
MKIQAKHHNKNSIQLAYLASSIKASWANGSGLSPVLSRTKTLEEIKITSPIDVAPGHRSRVNESPQPCDIDAK